MSLSMKKHRGSKSSTKIEAQLITLKKLKFADLPLDLLIRIEWYLDPLDILALRQCCKAAYRSTKEKSVWIDVLSRVCEAQRVFLPSFPIQNMSRLALEHAAASPYIFTEKLKKCDETSELTLPATAIRILPCHSDHPPFIEILLAPGGRFLFTTAVPDLIELWDLGNGADMMPNRPIASVQLTGASMDEEERLQITAQPTADGTGIRFVIPTLLENPEHTTVLNLYEIFPTSPEPAFSLLRSLEMVTAEFRTINCYHMTTDKLVFCCEERVVIWNFDLHLLASIVTDRDSASAGPVIYHHDFVVICREEEFSVYPAPPLEILETNRLPELEASSVQSPMLRIMCPLEEPVMSWPLHWYDDSLEKPDYFFNALGKRDADHMVMDYTFKPMQPLDNRNKGVFAVLPVSTNEVMDNSIEPMDKVFFSAHLSGDDKLLLWKENHQLRFRLGSGKFSKKGVFWKWGELDEAWEDQIFSICPYSGRLCVVTGKQQEIRIIDFVYRPSPYCAHDLD